MYIFFFINGLLLLQEKTEKQMGKNNKDDLGDRMKCYERVPKNFLMRRQPVIVRIDGKSFHTFTHGFKKPFDEILARTMQETMKYLCENIQGCVLGYTQSDEITLVLTDYKELNTSAWFDYNVQKCCSIASSMATLAFNQNLSKVSDKWFKDHPLKTSITQEDIDYNTMLSSYFYTIGCAEKKGAMFDARVFNVPFEEVTNCLLWRQLDAERNSVQMLGRAYFSHKELNNVSCKGIKEKLSQEKQVYWYKLPTYLKRGSCCVKEPQCEECIDEYENISRPHWQIDLDIPKFVGENRDYVEKRIYFNKE